MRVETNLMLRGSSWSLRMAVPKALRELRIQAGKAAGSKEVWRSLGTGDRQIALRKVVEAKAVLLRDFDTETAGLKEALHTAPRTVPSDFQLEQAVFAFKTQERGELYRERLHHLPTGKQVRDAKDQRFIVDSTPPSSSETTWERFCKRLELDCVIDRKQGVTERRQALRVSLEAHLKENEFVLVDWAIQQIAEQHGYLIEEDDRSYRTLGSLIIRAWIQELDAADSVFMNLDVPASTANLFQAGHLGGQPSANDSSDVDGIDPVESERDILVLFEDYLSDQKKSLSASGEADIRRTMQQLVESSGTQDVLSIRKAHITTYKKRLQQLPPNATRDYPGKTMLEIIGSMRAGADTLKPKTINAKLSSLSMFGKWLAQSVDDVTANNFATAPLPVAGQSDSMSEFTDEEVCAIFLSPTFTGCAGEHNQSLPGSYRVRDYRFWLPIMAAYTGCRLNELAQLRNDDIVEQDGGLALMITDAGDGQSLKTKTSKRIVPVHSALIAMGFRKRWETSRAAGDDFFHDAPMDRRGRRSEAAGKRFRKYLYRIGLKNENQRGAMHRFRHTVVEKLRRAGSYDHEIAPLVGHSASLAPMTQGYGSSRQMTLEQRKEAIETIRYEGLSLALLAP